MATLVHDDLDRRRHAETGPAVRLERARRGGRQSSRRLPLRRARSRSSRPSGRRRRRRILAERLARARAGRGDAAPAAARPRHAVEAYLERCALKTGKLFEAACLLGGGSGGVRPCCSASRSRSPTTSSTARATRSRRARSPAPTCATGTPTLPLLLAAREDELVREALAGGAQEGVLVRVAATGALERSSAVAHDYARRARAALDGESGAELEALDRRRRRPRSADGTFSPERARWSRSGRRSRRASAWTSRTGWRCSSRTICSSSASSPTSRDDCAAATDEVYFVQNLYVNQTNVCRVKCKFCAFAATQKQPQAYTITRRGARRGRPPPARDDRLHRDPHGQRREPARRLRLLPRHDRVAARGASRTCISSATRRPRSTT